MARIPDDTLNRLKNDISIQRLAEGQGIELKQHGQDLIGLCPFHDDTDPSLVITPSKNLWHCLGACQTGGSVIDWVMKADGVSFRHAVELLLNDHKPVMTQAPVKKTTVKKLPTALDDGDDKALLMQVVDYYHQCLKQTPDALAYATQRGLTREAIEHFKLGFSDRTLGYRLPEKNRKAGATVRGQLQRIGLLRNTGHEHFRGSLVIPIINDGTVLEMYGRKIVDKVRKGTPLHLYLPGPHRGVFNLDALKMHDEIILCESLIDALTFWNAGYKNVTCSYGIECFTKEHLTAFKEHSIKRILIAYDRDEAGNNAATTLAAKLITDGIDCYRIEFPKGMDANEYAVNVGPASKSLGLVIRKAVWLGKGAAKNLPTTGMTLADTDEPENIKSDTLKQQAPIAEQPVTPKHDEPSIEIKEEPKPIISLAADVVDDKPLPASPLPSPSVNLDAQVNDDEVVIKLDTRRYRIRGFKKNLNYDQLKVNMLASQDEALHVDTFDLYAARPRAAYIKQVSLELGVNEDVIKKDLSQILLKLETLQDEHIQTTLTPKENEVSLNNIEHADAMALLKAPDLLQRILEDYHRCGVVGETTNKLVGYLAAVSRKLDKPLAVIIQSTSAAGKSALMDAVLAFIPEEERIQYSAMTGQSLFYMGENNLKHKILAISEEEGASQAAYALKLLQSEGQLTIASTGKDPDSGKHVTHEYKVEGPVMIFSTTTAIDIDEELLNRCLVLTVDENREQTKAIHDLQRYEETLEGLLASQAKDDILKIHRNAQRLLKSLKVVNPFAKHLTFLDDKTRTRRDHKKYLTLIRSITLLHQYQRENKTTFYKGKSLQYIEVTLDDIETANTLAHEVLGRSLDELPPQPRKLLIQIESMVDAQCIQQKLNRVDYRFSRRDVREHTGWGNTQLKVHLQRLEEMEYLLIHRGQRGQQIVYELLYDGQGQDGQTFMMKLIDTEKLKKHHYDDKKSGVNTEKSGSSRPQVGAVSGLSRIDENQDNDLLNNNLDNIPTFIAKNADQDKKNNKGSYRNHTLSSLAAKPS